MSWFNSIGRSCICISVVLFFAFSMEGCTSGSPGGGGGGNTNTNTNTNTNDNTGPGPVEGAVIYGTVFHAQTGVPLAGARISAAGIYTQETSDDQGRFAFPVDGAGTYDLSIELDGYTFAQRRATVSDDQLATVREIYLTPLDPSPFTIGADGGTGRNSDESIEVEIPAGALAGDVEMRATWFERGRDLPNSLPELSHWTYACELTPDGQTFTEPITVRMRNDRGFAPGTPIPVGVYSRNTLEWEHESMGVVSEDGQWVVFEASHFSSRDCNLGRVAPGDSGDPGDAEEIDEEQTQRNNQSCGSVRAGSNVDVADGHLSVDHILPVWWTMDTPRTVAFQYNSSKVTTSILLGLNYDISRTSVELPDRIRFTVSVGGQRKTGYFDPVEGPMYFSYLWDGRDGMGNELPDGEYAYEMTLVNEYQAEFATADEFGGEATGGTGVMADEYVEFPSTFTGTVLLERTEMTEEPFGRGWGMVDHYRLEQEGDSVGIYSGGGNRSVFTNEGGLYVAAAGDFTTLATGDGNTFLWTLQNGTVITFDSTGLQTRTTDLAGNVTWYGYDANDRLTSITDSLEYATTLSYDDNGNLNSVTDPFDRPTLFEIDDDGDLVEITNPDGNTRVFTYDDHLMRTQRDAGGYTTEYTWDDANAITRVDYPDRSHSEFAISGARGTINAQTAANEDSPVSLAGSTYTDPTGDTWTFTVNRFGTRTSITNPLDLTITMERDSNDLMTALYVPGNKVTAYDYDTRGRMTAYSGIRAADETTITWDDTTDLPVRLDDPAGGYITNTYDETGNLASTRTIDGQRFTFTNNARGQRLSALHQGDSTIYSYNTQGNLASVTLPDGGVWRFEYDTYGNPTSITDPDDRQTSMTWDIMNQMTSQTNGEGDRYSIEYAPAHGSVDLEGVGPVSVVSRVTDGRGNSTTYTWDEMYRLQTRTDALGNTTRYDFDGAGRLRQIAQANGQTVDYEYNGLGQITRKILNDTDVTTYTYSTETGLLASMSNDACQIDVTYGDYNLVTRVDTTTGGTPLGAVEYIPRRGNYQESLIVLDIDGDTSDFGFSFDYNDGWNPTGLYGGSYFWMDVTRDSSGNITLLEEFYPPYESFSYSWDNMSRLLSSSAGGTRATYDYTDSGFLASLQISGGNTQSYTYDDAGRIETVTSSLAVALPNESYTYDAAGNRYVEGAEADYSYDTANRLTADDEYDYTYDASGNLLTRTERATAQVTTFTYNAENKLSTISLPDGTGITLEYDPLGRLFEKQVDGDTTRYVYDRDQVLAELDGSNRVRRQYMNTTVLDQPLALKVGTGIYSTSDYAIVSTPIGSPLMLMNDDGDLVQHCFYSGFGQPEYTDSPVVTNNRMFAGMEYIPEAEIYLARNRAYDPSTGRFLQRDLEFFGQAIAPYVYAGNNPVSARDPFGLEQGSRAGQTWSATQDRITDPMIDTAIGEGLSHIPEVGAGASRVFGTYKPWLDVVKVYGNENPAQAGVDWYRGRWWNPASRYMDGFLTIGGTFERRDARIHQVCGLMPGLRGFLSR